MILIWQRNSDLQLLIRPSTNSHYPKPPENVAGLTPGTSSPELKQHSCTKGEGKLGIALEVVLPAPSLPQPRKKLRGR